MVGALEETVCGKSAKIHYGDFYCYDTKVPFKLLRNSLKIQRNCQSKFLEMKKIMDHLINLRLKILSGVLTQVCITMLLIRCQLFGVSNATIQIFLNVFREF